MLDFFLYCLSQYSYYIYMLYNIYSVNLNLNYSETFQTFGKFQEYLNENSYTFNLDSLVVNILPRLCPSASLDSYSIFFFFYIHTNTYITIHTRMHILLLCHLKVSCRHNILPLNISPWSVFLLPSQLIWHRYHSIIYYTIYIHIFPNFQYYYL